jgi:hypothetical protein
MTRIARTAAGAGMLAAGGEDLLIGGGTSYDGDAASANSQQIGASRVVGDADPPRAPNLASGAGVRLLDATVVTGNGSGNVLAGRGGLGLLFTDGLDTISGFDPNSQQVAITP